MWCLQFRNGGWNGIEDFFKEFFNLSWKVFKGFLELYEFFLKMND